MNEAAVIGVDLAETYVHAELFDARLRRRRGHRRDLRADESRPSDVVGHIVSAVRALAVDGPVAGVGVSLPGQLERAWVDVPVREMLAEALALPLYLDNPLKAMTVAELCFGAGRHRRDVIVVNLGTGVGVGIAIGGTLFRGATNNAGEWGHTTLVLDGRLCRCGCRGCVEAYVGAPGIAQHLRELAPGSPLTRCDDQTGTIDALADAAGGADPVAAKVISETARFLGTGLGDLVNMLNPELIVLGGWVGARLGRYLLPEVRAVLDRVALRQPLRALTIRLSDVDRNPVSLGAAIFALRGASGRPAGPQ